MTREKKMQLEDFVVSLATYLDKNPEQRIGQAIVNMMRASETDIYYLTDETLAKLSTASVSPS